jgi:outer membrane cobalamin receptor
MQLKKLRWLGLWLSAFMVCLAAVGQAMADDQMVETGNVVVTATKTAHLLDDVPVKTEVITRQEIEDKKYKTAQEALQQIAGLRVDMTSGSWGDKGKVRIRGLDSEHVLVLVDGHRVYGGHSASVDLQSYPAEMIERIEVVKGPGSALYGSEAMGGVVNIITRKPVKGKDFSASAAYGSRNRKILEATGGLKEGNLGSLLSYTYKHSDGIDADFDKYDEHAVHGTLSYDFSSRAQVSLKPYFSEHRIDYEDRVQQRIGLNPSWEWSPDILSTIRFWGSWFSYDHESDDPETGEKDTDYTHDMYEMELNYSRLIFDRHLLTVGSQFEMEERDDTVKEYDADEDVLSFFISDEIDLHPLVLVLGARLDEHDEWGSEFTPKINISYSITDSIKLRGSAGRGFNAPTLSKLYGQWRMGPYEVQPNPDLEPEESWGYDLGVDWQAGPSFSLSTTLFQNDVENLIVSRTVRQGRPPWDLFWKNVDEARTRGVEISAALDFLESWSANIGYTYLDTENLETGKELLERANHKIDMSLGWRHPSYGISAFLEGQYLGRRYADEENEKRLGGYTLFNMVINKNFAKHYQAFVRVDNLLGKKDIDDAYDVDGTEFLAGINMRF